MKGLWKIPFSRRNLHPLYIVNYRIDCGEIYRWRPSGAGSLPRWLVHDDSHMLYKMTLLLTKGYEYRLEKSTTDRRCHASRAHGGPLKRILMGFLWVLVFINTIIKNTKQALGGGTCLQYWHPSDNTKEGRSYLRKLGSEIKIHTGLLRVGQRWRQQPKDSALAMLAQSEYPTGHFTQIIPEPNTHSSKKSSRTLSADRNVRHRVGSLCSAVKWREDWHSFPNYW